MNYSNTVFVVANRIDVALSVRNMWQSAYPECEIVYLKLQPMMPRDAVLPTDHFAENFPCAVNTPYGAKQFNRLPATACRELDGSDWETWRQALLEAKHVGYSDLFQESSVYAYGTLLHEIGRPLTVYEQPVSSNYRHTPELITTSTARDFLLAINAVTARAILDLTFLVNSAHFLSPLIGGKPYSKALTMEDIQLLFLSRDVPLVDLGARSAMVKNLQEIGLLSGVCVTEKGLAFLDKLHPDFDNKKYPLQKLMAIQAWDPTKKSMRDDLIDLFKKQAAYSGMACRA